MPSKKIDILKGKRNQFSKRQLPIKYRRELLFFW